MGLKGAAEIALNAAAGGIHHRQGTRAEALFHKTFAQARQECVFLGIFEKSVHAIALP